MENRAVEEEKAFGRSTPAVKARGEAGTPLVNALRLEILELQQRLKECEEVASRHAVMLREGDHRIKNSLQIVASLMSLQEKSEITASAQQALHSAAARVRSVAAIHDALQGAVGEDSVDLGAVLRIMCASLQTMAGAQGHITVAIDAPSLRTRVALAQPLVLAVNELVVNALRHAFPDSEKGSVRVTLMRDARGLCITVIDDGIGLPDNYDSAGPGYGMKLLGMMIRQVGGDLEVNSKAGTRFTIRAPLPAAPRTC